MKLVANWRKVLTRAWSARFSMLSCVFSGLAAGIWVLLDEHSPIFTISFILGSLVLSTGALVARIVWQKDFHPDEE